MSTSGVSVGVNVSDISSTSNTIQRNSVKRIGAPQNPPDKQLKSILSQTAVVKHLSASTVISAANTTSSGASGLYAMQFESGLFLPQSISNNGSPTSGHHQELNSNIIFAMHTFVANLEGQVCVLKGDTLVLLDDTNSYWWLVRCLKTAEVGYIPADNIEVL